MMTDIRKSHNSSSLPSIQPTEPKRNNFATVNINNLVSKSINGNGSGLAHYGEKSIAKVIPNQYSNTKIVGNLVGTPENIDSAMRQRKSSRGDQG